MNLWFQIFFLIFREILLPTKVPKEERGRSVECLWARDLDRDPLSVSEVSSLEESSNDDEEEAEGEEEEEAEDGLLRRLLGRDDFYGACESVFFVWVAGLRDRQVAVVRKCLVHQCHPPWLEAQLLPSVGTRGLWFGLPERRLSRCPGLEWAAGVLLFVHQPMSHGMGRPRGMLIFCNEAGFSVCALGVMRWLKPGAWRGVAWWMYEGRGQ